MQGQARFVLALVRQGTAAWWATGTTLLVSYLCAVLAISFAIFTLVGYSTYESATATSTPVR